MTSKVWSLRIPHKYLSIQNHTHTHTHTQTQTYTHTHTHTQAQAQAHAKYSSLKSIMYVYL